jgi:pre-rRNA-processing protein TSR3
MLKQDDPLKCTAAKLVKFRLALSIKFIPKNSLVLNPFSAILLSKQDARISNSICAIDCSWERAEYVLANQFTMTRGRGIGRRLPMMLAANPTNYSKLGRLSSAEALSGSLYILGYREKAKEIMNKFKWGHTFFELNGNLLEEYTNAKSMIEIVQCEKEYFAQLC